MSTIWTLREQGVRFSYSPAVRTFFWVDDKFYNDHKNEILIWANLYKCQVPAEQYGWIECPDDEVALMFRLRWS